MSSGKDQGTNPLRGTPSITPEDGIKLLSMQIDKGKGFDVTFDENAFRSWDNTTRNYLEKAFGENHRNVINFEAIRFTCNAPRSHFAFLSLDYFRTFQGKITALKGHIEELETDIRLRPSSVSIQSSATPGVSKKVFIVHGHDGELKEATALLVTRLGLEPVILNEQSDEGRTIIEKFEDHALEVTFAIVLLSADDLGGPAAASRGPFQPRARQNVIFELGFFYGSLGRRYVCAVCEKNIEWPSDLHGLVYIEYDQGGSWKNRVAKQLKAAGYEVNLDKL